MHTSAAEDLSPYLDGDCELPRYAAVSHTGSEGHAYITSADSAAAALGYLERVIADDIYPEAPLYVLDFDTGKRRRVLVALALAKTEA